MLTYSDLAVKVKVRVLIGEVRARILLLLPPSLLTPSLPPSLPLARAHSLSLSRSLSLLALRVLRYRLCVVRGEVLVRGEG